MSARRQPLIFKYPRFGRAAIDIFDERFARGEIDKGEFEDKRKLLGR